MAASVNPAAKMLVEQVLASMMGYPSSTHSHSFMHGRQPDPVLDSAGYAAYAKGLDLAKRSHAEDIAKHHLIQCPLELTPLEALAPIPTSLPLLKLHALTPRQATEHDEQKQLFLAHKTREFRIELQKYDDDIAGRKEAIIRFGDFVLSSLFGLDWAQTTLYKYSGQATPSSIYTDGDTYDTRYAYGQPNVGNLCHRHVAALNAHMSHSAQATTKSEPGDQAGKPKEAVGKEKVGKEEAAAGRVGKPGVDSAQKRFEERLKSELLRWKESREKVEGFGSEEDPINDYSYDPDPYAQDYPYDLDDPYGDLDYPYDDYEYPYGGLHDPYNLDDPEDYLPYDPMLYDDYDDYLDAVWEMRMDEMMYALPKKEATVWKVPRKGKKRRGKKTKAGKKATASTNKQGDDGIAGEVEEGKGKEKVRETSAADAKAQISTARDGAVTSDSGLNTPQKPVSSLQWFKNPLEPGSSLAARKSASPLTTASVGLNLAKPAAAVGRFSLSAAKGNGEGNRTALPENKGPTAEEPRQEFLQKSDAVLPKMKANAQNQAAQTRSRITVTRSGNEIKLTFSLPGTGAAAPSNAKVQNGAAGVDPPRAAAAQPKVGVPATSRPHKAATAAQNVGKTPSAKRRNLAASSGSSDAAPATLKPARKKLNAGATAAAAAKLPIASASSTSTGKPDEQSITKDAKQAKPVKSAQATPTPKTKQIKYEVVVFKKHFLPTKRPQRDCWHGRVGL